MNELYTKSPEKIKHRLFFLPFVLLIGLVLPTSVNSQLLIEPFNYIPDPTNGLAAQSAGAWTIANTGDSILVTSGNLYYSNLAASTGNKVSYGGAGTDYFRAFTPQVSGTTYGSCIINVTALPPNTTGDYAISLANSTSTFGATVWFRASTTGGKYNIGISTRSNSVVTWLSNNLDINTSYFIVFAYQIISGTTNDVGKIWLNPISFNATLEPTPDATAATGTDMPGVAMVMLRQGSATTAVGGIDVDELRVGTTWAAVTPGSNSGYYRTKQNGNWNDAAAWETSSDQITWTTASQSPDLNANTITILNGHTITVTDTRTIDQTVVNSGGAIVINSGASLRLNDGPEWDLKVNGSITISSGGSLYFISNSTGTASLGPSTGSINGNTTVERFISSAGNRAYRLLAPIVNTGTSIKYNWQEGVNNTSQDPANNQSPNAGYGTHITGSTTGANGFDATQTGQASLFTYDQVSSTQAWVPIANTDINTLSAKTGYLLFVRGDRSASNLYSTTSSNTILRATGTLLIGDQAFTTLESNGRFSLVTNPFASPINWTNIYNDNSTSFENSYTYWDPNTGMRGTYVTVNSSGINSGGTNATVEIQSGQAFFVKTKTGVTSPTLTIKESHKSTTNNIDVFRVGSPETFRLKLFFSDNGTRRLADGAVAVFNNDYSTGVDGNDAEEIANFDENIAIARDNKMLSIEGRPLIDANDNIPLSIARLRQQQYEWQFEPSDFSAPNLQAYLQDKFLNTQMPVSLSSTTVIPFTVTSDPASAAADRFTVVFSANSTLPVTLTSVKAYQKTNGIQVEWNIATESNIDKYEVEKSTNGQQFIKVGTVSSTGNSASSKTYNWFDATPNAGTNYYRIRSVSKGGTAEYSSIVRVALTNLSDRVSVYPNPVKGDVVGLQLNNLNKGTYTISIINKLGQQVYSKVIEHQGGSASQTLQTQAMAAGIYQLQLTGDQTNITTQLIKQ